MVCDSPFVALSRNTNAKYIGNTSKNPNNIAPNGPRLIGNNAPKAVPPNASPTM